jgi:2-succinyl-6-hydroxy-2,4-cyclohexadiene-1-carboxylate synthase
LACRPGLAEMTRTLAQPSVLGPQSFRVAVDGLTYHVERAGAGAGTALVLLHGFTGSAATWAPFLPAFAREFDTVAIDLPGHGATEAPRDPARYRMERTVADLAAILERLGIARAAWLGYSLGGRVALGVAALAPSRVAALVLEGASPGIADPAERAARVRSDEALAARIERAGVAAFVDEWEGLPLFASQGRLPADVRAAHRRQRLASDPAGLASSLRGIGQGAQPPLHDRLGEIAAPTLLLAGAEDSKFRRLAAEMAAGMPAAEVVVIEGAGHAAHLEQPRAFEEAVLAFVRRLDPPADANR